MNNDRRQLLDWEKDECAALKAALAAFNANRPKEKRLTQEDIALSLGMSQGTLGSHLNGHRAVSQKLAVGMAKLLEISIEQFSPRLAKEIADIASVVTPSQEFSSQSSPPDVARNHRTLITSPVISLTADSNEREILKALAVIVTVAANGNLSVSHARSILKIRNEIVHATKSSDAHELPGNLEGIASAAFTVAENGGNPDDLISMLQHGMDKKSHKDKGVKDVRHKKSSTK